MYSAISGWFLAQVDFTTNVIMENIGKNLDSIGQFVDLMQRNVMYVENLALSVQALHES